MSNRRSAALLVLALLIAPLGALSLLAPTAVAAPPTNLTSVSASPTVLSPADRTTNPSSLADSTTITVNAQAGQTLYLNIYDSANNLRRTALPLAETVAGTYVATWDGRENGGALVTAATSPYDVMVTTDTVGNTLNEGLHATTIMVDDTAPAGVSLSIDSGARYVVNAQRSVTLTIAATAPTTGFQMRVVEGAADTAFSGVAWENFGTSKPFTLSANDGAKTLRLQVRDAAGNLASTVTATTTLDLTNPTGSVTINGGDATTTSTAVRLGISATDANGVTQMRISNDGGATFPNGWETYATTKSWTLGGTGSQSVLVEFRDDAGRASTATDSITVQTAVQGQSISIAGGAPYSTSADGQVTLNLVNPQQGTYTQMSFSNTGLQGSFSPVETFQTTKTWALLTPAVDGQKTVYFRLTNPGTGATSDASDTIIRDTIAPSASLSVEDANGFAVTTTTANGVILSVTGNDANGIGGGRFGRTDGERTAGAFRALPAGGKVVWCFEDAYPLAANRANIAACPVSTDGAKTVQFQVQDGASLTSTVVSRTVTRDNTAPAFTGVSIAGLVGGAGGRTRSDTLDVTLTAGADASKMAFALDGGDYGAWMPFAATSTYTVPAASRTDGNHTLAVRVRDAAGNVATPVTAAFAYDGTAPTGSFSIIANGLTNPATTPTRNVTLAITANDASGVTGMRAWLSGTSEPTTAPAAFATTLPFTLADVQASQTINLRLFDAVGNPSVVLSRAIAYALDTGSVCVGCAPPPPSCAGVTFTLAGEGPAGYTRSRNVAVTLSSLPAGCTVAVGFGSAPTSGFASLGTTIPVTLEAREGLHTVYVSLRSSDGQIGQPAPQRIVLDTVAPVTNAGIDETLWRREGFTFQLEVVDATSGVASTAWQLDGGAATAGSVVTIPDTLADGEHTLTFRSTDAAGNVEAERSVKVRLDRRAPVTTVDLPDGMATTEAFTLTFASFDLASGVAGVRYRIDASDGAFTTLTTSPYRVPIPVTLGAGNHTVEYSAIDAAGNQEAVGTFRFCFGCTPPSSNPVPPVPAPDAPTGASISVTARPGAPVEIPLDGLGVFTRAVATISGSPAQVHLAFAPVPQGIALPDAAAWQLVDIRLLGANGAAVPGVVDLSFNVSRGWLESHNLRAGQLLVLHWDGAAWEALAPTLVSQDPAHLGSAGNMTFTVRIAAFSPFAIVGDAIAPTLTAPVPAADSTVPSAARVQVNVADNVQVKGYVFAIDDLDLTSRATLKDGVLGVSNLTLAAGAHLARVQVTDAAGNVKELAWRFTVAQVVPTPLVLSVKADAVAGDRAKFVWSRAVDPTTLVVIVDNQPLPAQAILESTATGFVLDTSGLSKGAHSARATVRDAEGNEQTVTFTVQGTQETKAKGRIPGPDAFLVLAALALAVGLAAVAARRQK